MTKRRFDAIARRAAIGLALVVAAAATLGHVSAQQSARLPAAAAGDHRRFAHRSTGEYQAAADRQRAELDRTTAYARSIGCDRRQFLFFGSAPPRPMRRHQRADRPHARPISTNCSRAPAAARAGAADLIARYNAQCATPGAADQPFRRHLRQPSGPTTSRRCRCRPTQPLDSTEAQAGAKAVCVRSCDGAFFPVSYSASAGRLAGPRGHVPRALPQRRGFALHLSRLRPDRTGGVDQRRALRRQPQCAEIPPEL